MKDEAIERISEKKQKGRSPIERAVISLEQSGRLETTNLFLITYFLIGLNAYVHNSDFEKGFIFLILVSMLFLKSDEDITGFFGTNALPCIIILHTTIFGLNIIPMAITLFLYKILFNKNPLYIVVSFLLIDSISSFDLVRDASSPVLYKIGEMIFSSGYYFSYFLILPIATLSYLLERWSKKFTNGNENGMLITLGIVVLIMSLLVSQFPNKYTYVASVFVLVFFVFDMLNHRDENFIESLPRYILIGLFCYVLFNIMPIVDL